MPTNCKNCQDIPCNFVNGVCIHKGRTVCGLPHKCQPKKRIHKKKLSNRNRSDLQSVKFTYKNDPKQHLEYAEEVDEIFPELMDHDEISTVHYDRLISLLLDKLQTHEEEINNLKQLLKNHGIE